MPRDYAKVSRKRRPASQEKKGRGLWLATALLTGLFVVGLVYLKQQSAHLTAKEDKPITKQIAKSPEHAATTKQPHFDFYTLLPKAQMTAAPIQLAVDAKPVKAEKPPIASSSATTYMLQFGVFKDYPAADELKAQMVLQGFDVNISPTKKGDATLYRVLLGPYPTRTEALQQQKKLLQNQIKSLLLPLKKS